MNKKKGISLIVLVITIIVMIILAAAVMVTLGNTGIIDKADEAVKETDAAQLQEVADLAWADAYLDNKLDKNVDMEDRIIDALAEAGMDKSRYDLNISTSGATIIDKNAVSNIVKPVEKPKNPKITLDQTLIERTIIINEPESAIIVATTEDLTKDLIWTTSNEGVVSVVDDGEQGVITMRSEGTAIITAKSGDVSASCTVTVKLRDPDPVLTLDVVKDNVDLKLDDEATRKITATLLNSTENIVWSVDNEEIATVTSENNVATVTFVDKGEVILTATAGEISATCNFTVEDWKDSVSEITEDGVPIPNGFVKSPYEGEGEKSTGLVIYALTEEEIENGVKDITEIDKDMRTSLENRNQFVWVPVEAESFKTTFKRKNYTEDTKCTLSKKIGKDFWEVQLTYSNMPADRTINSEKYMTQETYDEVVAMYNSVIKYGGYYMGRYEAGRPIGGTQTASGIYVAMRKYPYNNLTSGSAIVLARKFYPADNILYGAASTLVYGVQWDRTIGWWLELNPDLNVDSSINYGNFPSTYVSKLNLNQGALLSYRPLNYWYNTRTKYSGETALYTTGAYKRAKVGNIYDLAGNLEEWTMEKWTFSTECYHVARGGDFSNDFLPTVAKRQFVRNYPSEYWHMGFRPSLYIK